MKTKEEILKSKGITDETNLYLEYHYLYNSILEAMQQYAEQYYEEKVETIEAIEEKYEPLVEFVKSFKKRAWDAWKPVQMFRSDREVEDDEIRRELLEELNDEAEQLLCDLDQTTK